MDGRIYSALKSGISAYISASGIDATFEDLYQSLKGMINSEAHFMDKVDKLDEFFDEHPELDELRELTYDLMLINFFSDDIKLLEDDYLDSVEWLEIEDQTIDRGTELLNVLLYLKECADEEVEPELNDFLKEFLLVDEDEFQDEYRIYEPIIANQALIEGTYSEIQKISENLYEYDEEIATLFYPFMSYFNEKEPSMQQFAEYLAVSKNKPIDGFVYAVMVSYFKPEWDNGKF